MNTSPMAHTTEHEWFSWVKVNGKLVSEFSLNALYAADMGSSIGFPVRR